LAQKLPDSVRDGLETELKKLQTLNNVLLGTNEKSSLHQLRAKLRWARKRLTIEKNSAKRQKIENEISEIQEEIKKDMGRKERSKEQRVIQISRG
jgi:hypothetical protein